MGICRPVYHKRCTRDDGPLAAQYIIKDARGAMAPSRYCPPFAKTKINKGMLRKRAVEGVGLIIFVEITSLTREWPGGVEIKLLVL